MASKLLLAFSLSLAVTFTVAADDTSSVATTTIMMPWVGFKQEELAGVLEVYVGSIISANPTATTVSFTCAPHTECGVYPRETIVFGPSTYNMDCLDRRPDSDRTATIDCVIGRGAVCANSVGGANANFAGSSTETFDAESVGTGGLRITAGVEKLNFKAGATTESEAEATASSHADGSHSGSLSASTGSVAPSGTASPTGSAAAPESTGAADGNAVVGGGLLSIAAGVLGGLLLW